MLERGGAYKYGAGNGLWVFPFDYSALVPGMEADLSTCKSCTKYCFVEVDKRLEFLVVDF